MGGDLYTPHKILASYSLGPALYRTASTGVFRKMFAISVKIIVTRLPFHLLFFFHIVNAATMLTEQNKSNIRNQIELLCQIGEHYTNSTITLRTKEGLECKQEEHSLCYR